MRTPRGKLVAWCSVALGAVVLGVCGCVFRDVTLEEWRFHRLILKLNSGDEEERKAAAERLGEMGSVRAVPHLLQAIADRKSGPSVPGDLTWKDLGKYRLSRRYVSSFRIQSGYLPITVEFFDGKGDNFIERTFVDDIQSVGLLFDSRREVYFAALIKLSEVNGKAMAPYLSRGLKDENNWIRLLSAFHLGLLGPEGKTAIPTLREALQDKNEYVAGVAHWALMHIYYSERPVRMKIADAAEDP